MGSSPIRCAVLGPLAVFGADGQEVVVSGPVARRLLCALLAARPEAVSTDRLIEAVWQDDASASKNALRLAVRRLRTTFGETLAFRRNGYAINGSVEVDATRFSELVDASQYAEPRAAAALLGEALSLWRGRPFEDLEDAEDVQPLVVRLNEQRMVAEDRRIEALLEIGEVATAVMHGEAACATAPLREHSHGLLMAALARDGRAAEALRTFDRFRGRLAEETGLAPTARLVAIEAEVLQERITTIALPAGNPHLLPRSLTSFVGRSVERERVTRLLQTHTTAMVTITGVGGIGKTRLAIEVARAIAADYSGGAWMVDLSAVADGDRVAEACATALGVASDAAATPAGLVRALQDRGRTLMVLDNCEQVIDATARLVASISRSCPDVTVLATSREPLSLTGERIERLGSLGVASVDLFVDRLATMGTMMTEDDVQLVRAICERVDGLPLAIELAASRSDVLSLAEVFDGLDRPMQLLSVGARDAPDRHGSLEAVIAWSWNLLATEERDVLAACSVFRGGWSADAAAKVCVEPGVVDVLGRLVRKSLVVRATVDATSRYRLLDSVRSFASERLRCSSAEGRVSERHSQWASSVLARCGELWPTSDEAVATALCTTETENIRAGYAWATCNARLDLTMTYVRTLAACTNTNARRLALPVAAARAVAGADLHPHAALVAAATFLTEQMGFDPFEANELVDQIDIEGVDLEVRGAVRQTAVARPLVFGLAPPRARDVDRLSEIAAESGQARFRSWAARGRAALCQDEAERRQLVDEGLRINAEGGAPAGMAGLLLADAVDHFQAGRLTHFLASARRAEIYSSTSDNASITRTARMLQSVGPTTRKEFIQSAAWLRSLLVVDARNAYFQGALMGLAIAIAARGRTESAAEIGQVMLAAGWPFSEHPAEVAAAMVSHPHANGSQYYDHNAALDIEAFFRFVADALQSVAEEM